MEDFITSRVQGELRNQPIVGWNILLMSPFLIPTSISSSDPFQTHITFCSQPCRRRGFCGHRCGELGEGIQSVWSRLSPRNSCQEHLRRRSSNFTDIAESTVVSQSQQKVLLCLKLSLFFSVSHNVFLILGLNFCSSIIKYFKEEYRNTGPPRCYPSSFNCLNPSLPLRKQLKMQIPVMASRWKQCGWEGEPRASQKPS